MKAKLLSFLLAISSYGLFAQTSLSGKVYDPNTTEPVAGATVLIKGSNTATATDANGEFRIDAKSELPVTLVISFLGYVTKEYEVTNNHSLDIGLAPLSTSLGDVTVSARRRVEAAQEIPVPIAVLGAKEIDNSVSFNVNRIKELVPSVQLYSSNPRNTTLNIRGLGSTFGLTNDGIDPGVGFYVDGVYYARPAATTLDFIDVQQIEVLRGPQGTLFGKNTTAGTFNITTKKPTFTPTATFEQSTGNYSFLQAKGTVSGSLYKDKVAARLSLSSTQRDGTLYNTRTQKYTNTLNNQGLRAQILFQPTSKLSFTLAGDYTRQRPDGYAQVVAGVAPTLRSPYRQFANIAKDLNYTLPSQNPFDRIIDQDTPWKSDQDMGGASLNTDVELGKGKLTSTTAWRTWKWGPSNDRDFTGLQALALSQANSIHHQFSQEVRYAGDFTKRISGVIGAFAFYQKLDADGAQTEESGRDQWRFAQNSTSALWKTSGLLNGYGIRTYPSFRNFSGALFSQIDWKVTDKFTVLPGIRLNYDQKKVDFRRETYGGLQTTDANLIKLQKSVYSNQQFTANVTDWKLSGQLTLNYKLFERVRAFGTYSLGFKPVGLNLGGLPSNADGTPMTELAVIKPEQVNHVEFGIKSEPIKNSILNLTVYQSDIKNYQTNVQSAELGVNRGYLANAEKVRVRGAEIEANYTFSFFRLNASASYTEGKYVTFTNAPLPLEETGKKDENGKEIAFKDISGQRLPGVSKWIIAGGGELFTKGKFFSQEGEYFIGSDLYFRSDFSSSASESQYLKVPGYTLFNARFGFRAAKGVTVFVWGKNIGNRNYFEQLLAASGNSGLYAGVLGDPRTYGLTIKYNFF